MRAWGHRRRLSRSQNSARRRVACSTGVSTTRWAARTQTRHCAPCGCAARFERTGGASAPW
eukprot:14923995-Alexandrium_andersonii.AAC.1